MKRRKNAFLPWFVLLPVVSTTVAWGASISFDLTKASLSTSAGGTASFAGTVTNDSGANLNASDFFFNFFGFDAGSVTVTQELGVTKDFLIPNGSTSALVTLFDVQISAMPKGTSFPIDVELEDINSDASATQTVFVSISSTGSSLTPEPGSVFLTGAGLVALSWLRRKRGWGRVRKYALGVRNPTLLIAALLFWWADSPGAFAQSTTGPAFSTQTEAAGVVASTFYVFLPLLNSGAAAANNVQVTGVSLGSVPPANPALPLVIGTLNASDSNVLNLQFRADSVVLGRRYLLTVRGTYETGSTTLGFAVNRIITVAAASTTIQREVERWAAINAANAKFGSLAGVDPKSDMEELLAFIRTRPEFVDSGIDTTLPSVWAQFADGQQIIFSDDLLPNATIAKRQQNAMLPRLAAAPESTTAGPVGEATEAVPALEAGQRASGTPVSSTADFYSGLGAGFLLSDAMPHIATWSAAQKYGSGVVGDPSVEALKTVGGEGVFAIASHSGFGSGTYSVWTSTKADDGKETVARKLCTAVETGPAEVGGLPCDILHDLDAGRLVHSAAHLYDATGHDVIETHYGITTAFVEDYWGRFSQNSFVFLAACSSDAPSPDAQAFKEAVLLKGASVYAGWNGKVGDTYSTTVAQFLFDRVLGANQDTDFAENPPQRPFDYGSVLTALKKYGLQVDPNPANLGSTLQFTVNKDAAYGQFVSLAPSISNMAMDEVKGQLTINGIFGTDPRLDGSSPSVQVGGTVDTKNGVQVESNGLDVKIESWDTNRIVVDLPLSGTGSAGNVQVNARGHLSNVAQLTEWRGGKFVFTISLPGSLLARTTYNVHLREDIRKYRNEIEDAPREPGPEGFAAANDSRATIVCTGVAPVPGDPPIPDTWKGSATLSPAGSVPITTPSFVFDGTVISSTQMTVAGILNAAPLGEFAPGPEVCTYTMGKSSEPLPVIGPTLLPGFGVGPPTGITFQLTLDDTTQDIRANSPLNTRGYAYLGTPADARQSNYSFQWGAIPATPDTAPNPESAR